MTGRFMLIVPAAVALLLFAACGGDPTATPTPSPTPSDSTATGTGEPGKFEATIKWLKHQDIEISVGTTVVWDSEFVVSGVGVPSYHTVTSGNLADPDAGSLFDSGRVTEGDLFSYTFGQAGEFQYFCKVHPQFMKAVVKVQ